MAQLSLSSGFTRGIGLQQLHLTEDILCCETYSLHEKEHVTCQNNTTPYSDYSRLCSHEDHRTREKPTEARWYFTSVHPTKVLEYADISYLCIQLKYWSTLMFRICASNWSTGVRWYFVSVHPNKVLEYADVSYLCIQLKSWNTLMIRICASNWSPGTCWCFVSVQRTRSCATIISLLRSDSN
jgi:hypothetical protein